LTLLLFICNISLYAQEWVSLNGFRNIQKPIIEINTSSAHELIFSVKVLGFLSQKVNFNDVTYNEIYFPEYQTLNEIGKPALPVITELIGIPRSAGFKITITDSTWVQLIVVNSRAVARFNFATV
jgi:hypothetical protein